MVQLYIMQVSINIQKCENLSIKNNEELGFFKFEYLKKKIVLKESDVFNCQQHISDYPGITYIFCILATDLID